ncbi:MAG: TRAP transporter fused permease subunit [Synergistetes bacterium]|nr:TRAP transporter fused permease subunit [Synergistota bacterium]
MRWVIYVTSVLLISFHIYTAAFGSFIAQLQRSFHLTLAGILGFLFYPALRGKKIGKLDLILSALSGVAFGYIALNCNRIAERESLVSYLSPLDLLIGALVIILVIELARRTVGWVLSFVAALSLAYAYFGPHLPDIIAHPGISLRDIIDYQVYGLDGIYSIPLGVSSTYIVLFIIWGTVMEYSKTGDLIMDLGKLFAGKFRGGPAKVACITSALFGSLSGSAAANVYATGTFTIPMMVKIGYKPATAGAVEAVASTGGQIMPPVMGAAAFLMAEWLGVPYITICKAALLPAIFYYIALIFILDFEAAKLGIRGMSSEEIPYWRDVLKRIYLLVPLVFFIIVLIKGYTPFRAAFFAILMSFALSFLRKDTMLTSRKLLDVAVVSAKRTVMIASACAAAGIVIGIITLTGIGLSLSSIILLLSGGKLFLSLLLIMICCIIMGMGTPTTVAYVIVATLAVPTMGKLGFSSIPAHLFVFYFAVISMITPPVAIAAYAAGEIAKEDPMRIGFTAMKIALPVYIIPYVFLFDRSLLLEGSLTGIAFRACATFLSVLVFAGGVAGWFFGNIGWVWRSLLLMTFLLINIPLGRITVLGLALGLILTAFLFLKSRRGKAITMGKGG